MFDIRFITIIFILQAVAGFDEPTNGVSISKNEGDSVILNTDDKISPRDRFTWFFNNVRIAQIIGNSSCMDVQCEDGDERFRDRLKLDHQTGSLTITNTRTTDSGLYQLQFNHRAMKFYVKVSEVGRSVTVMEGESVALHTFIETKQQDKIIWYFNNIRIAQIIGRQKTICTEMCPKRFRYRLKLDDQTGSLTITNTSTSDSGKYTLQINSNTGIIFSVTFQDVPASQKHEIKNESFKEGETLTLNFDELKNTSYLMKWYFNDICIAEIRGDRIKTGTNDQCKDGDGTFRDRWTVDYQNGSLIITNTRTTDSGPYRLEINHRISNRFTITWIKSFSVMVTGSGLPLGARARVGVVLVLIVLLVAAAALGVIYCGKRTGQNHLNKNVTYSPAKTTANNGATANNTANLASTATE